MALITQCSKTLFLWPMRQRQTQFSTQSRKLPWLSLSDSHGEAHRVAVFVSILETEDMAFQVLRGLSQVCIILRCPTLLTWVAMVAAMRSSTIASGRMAGE